MSEAELGGTRTRTGGRLAWLATTIDRGERAFGRLSVWQRIGLITIVGGVFRLVFLGQQELWRDEAFTAVVVRLPLSDMLSAVSRDSAPPLAYLLDWCIARVDASPAALRLVPAIAGTALIPLVAALARRIRGDRAALCAACLVAVLPATVASSRDARMYALGGALSVAAVLLLWRAVERPSARRWMAYALVVAAASWTEYFDLLAIAAGLLAVALCLRPNRGLLLASVGWTALGGATLLPWLVVARAQFEHVGTPFWVEPLGVVSVAGSLVQFLSGPPIDPGTPFLLELQALQVIAGAAVLLAFGWLVARRAALEPKARWAAVFCFVAGFSGGLILFVASVARPVFDARYLSVMWLPLFALGGVGLSLAPRHVAAAIVTVIALPTLVLSIVPLRAQTAELVPAIEARLGPSDFIEASPRQFLLLLGEGNEALRSRLHVVGEVPWFWGTAAYPRGTIVPDVPASVVAARGRVLVVAEAEDSAPTVPAAYRPIESVCRVRVCLTVFGPP